VASGELWKLGQLKPGDKIVFCAVTPEQAIALRASAPVAFSRKGPEGDILRTLDGRTPKVTYRAAGDDYLLVEYGAMTLDIAFRLRVHLLMESVRAAKLTAIIDLTPGIRSLQIHYDSRILPQARLLGALVALEGDLADPRSVSVESRIVHLPLAWNDDRRSSR
jgi:urea carboxylase